MVAAAKRVTPTELAAKCATAAKPKRGPPVPRGYSRDPVVQQEKRLARAERSVIAKREKRAREKIARQEMKRQEEERAKLEAMALAEALARDAMPDEYVCPITQELMVDPVTCADGHSYERTAILQWLEKHDTSPKTGLVLAMKHVFPAIALRNLIADFREANPGIEF